MTERKLLEKAAKAAGIKALRTATYALASPKPCSLWCARSKLRHSRKTNLTKYNADIALMDYCYSLVDVKQSSLVCPLVRV